MRCADEGCKSAAVSEKGNVVVGWRRKSERKKREEVGRAASKKRKTGGM